MAVGVGEMVNGMRSPRLLAWGIRVEWFSLCWMVVEGVVGLLAGLRAHSLALTAFGADSAVELVAGWLVIRHLYAEVGAGPDTGLSRAADARAEGRVGLTLLVLAALILAGAAWDVAVRTVPQVTMAGLVLAMGSAVLMPLLAAAKKRLGKRLDLASLQADGSCSTACAYMAWILLADLVLQRWIDAWWLNAMSVMPLLYFIVREGLEGLEHIWPEP